MTTAVALPKSLELWNRLTSLRRSDVAGHKQIIWNLQGLARQQPGDFYTRLGLGRALLATGQRAAALEHIEAASGLCPRGELSAAYNMFNAFTFLGNLEKARKFFDIYHQGVGGTLPPQTWEAATIFAFYKGDVALLRELASAEATANAAENLARRFVRTLEEGGLIDMFGDYQSLIQSILNGRLCFIHISYINCGGLLESGEIFVKYYTDMSLEETAAAAHKLFEARDACAMQLGDERGPLYRAAVTEYILGPYVSLQQDNSDIEGLIERIGALVHDRG